MKRLFLLVLLAVLAAAVLHPDVACSQAATYRGSYVVSVDELAMSPKAMRTFKKGVALLQKGNAQASVSYFEKTIVLAPGAFRSYHNLALAQYLLGQFDAAELNFQKSIELSKGGFAPSSFALGMILYRRAEFSLAEPILQRGVLVAPDSGLGRYCLALVQFSLGHLADSERSALTALKLDPAQTDAYVLLAHIHQRLRNPSAVIADIHSYLQLTPDHDLDTDASALLAQAQQDVSRLSAN